MMYLFIDTHSKDLNIGLVNDEQLLDEIKIKDLENHSNLFLCKLDEILKRNKLQPKDINKIIVVNGPGSFTGIRIGVTAAKVFAWGLKKEITTISSLKAYALSIKNSDYIVPLIDARRGYVYGAIYDSNMNAIIEDTYVELNNLISETSKLNGNITFVGNINNNVIKSVQPDLDILRIINYAKNIECINPHSVNPNYLKKTEAEENNDKRS